MSEKRDLLLMNPQSVLSELNSFPSGNDIRHLECLTLELTSPGAQLRNVKKGVTEILKTSSVEKLQIISLTLVLRVDEIF